MRSIIHSSLSAILLFGASAHAQTFFGPMGGVNLARVETNSPTFGPSTLLGVVIGLQFEGSIGKNLWLSPEVTYVQKGDRQMVSTLGNAIDARLYLDYINSTLQVKYGFGRLERTRFLVGAGPYFGYLTGASASVETTVNGRSQTASGRLDPEDIGITRIDAGACVSGAVAIPTGGGSLRIEMRYEFGIADIDDTDDRTYNRSTRISLAYLFGGHQPPPPIANPFEPALPQQ